MTTRTPIIGGNWKMNTNQASGAALARAVAKGVAAGAVTDSAGAGACGTEGRACCCSASGSGSGSDSGRACEVVVFPPFPYLLPVREALAGSQVLLGAQDCYHTPDGAYTGEVSLTMLKDCSVSVVLVGHSERRHVIGEPDELINAKTRAVLGADLLCILCVGEKLDQREAGATNAVNEAQLRAGLAGVEPAQMARVVIAYEPVWAIGTGKVATPEDAQQAHAHIRAVLAELYTPQIADQTRLQYGGSLKPANAAELLAQPDIDGGLIGGASLKAEDFLAIIESARG